MTVRISILAPVVVLAAVSLTSAPADAHSHDTRPCVTAREYHSVMGKNLFLPDVEARWDVEGLGTISPYLGALDGILVTYPRCGEIKAGGWYAAIYDGQGRLIGLSHSQ